MFKNLISVLRDINHSLMLVKYKLVDISDNVKGSNFCDYYYVVEITFEKSFEKSFPLSTLKEVNEFINSRLFLGVPSRIDILRLFDDGR